MAPRFSRILLDFGESDEAVHNPAFSAAWFRSIRTRTTAREMTVHGKIIELESVLGQVPLPKGEGDAKRRVRGTTKNFPSSGTPHPALRATLSLWERDLPQPLVSCRWSDIHFHVHIGPAALESTAPVACRVIGLRAQNVFAGHCKFHTC